MKDPHQCIMVHVHTDMLITENDGNEVTRVVEYHECAVCGAGIRIPMPVKIHTS